MQQQLSATQQGTYEPGVDPTLPTTGHAAGVGIAAIVLGPWAAILAISGTFALLVTVSVLARLVNYLVTCLALPRFETRPLAIAGSIVGVALYMQATAQITAKSPSV